MVIFKIKGFFFNLTKIVLILEKIFFVQFTFA